MEIANQQKCAEEKPCMRRRHFLLAGGSLVMLSSLPGFAMETQAIVKSFERKLIAKLSELKTDSPVDFTYPNDEPGFSHFLVKLGTPAGGGVGENKDIVAFNSFCTHMGGPLMGTYKAQHKAMGPCPLHLTTFDLTRHGMVIAGHATDTLPQIVLEVEGDNIYATGIVGLVYGHFNNLG